MLGHEKNILNEKELEGVSGGKSASARGRKGSSNGGAMPTETHECSTCGRKTTHIVYSGGRAVCSVCGTPFAG